MLPQKNILEKPYLNVLYQPILFPKYDNASFSNETFSQISELLNFIQKYFPALFWILPTLNNRKNSHKGLVNYLSKNTKLW